MPRAAGLIFVLSAVFALPSGVRAALPVTASGTLTAPAGSPYATGAGPQAVAVADVNGDGNLDIVTVNSAGSSVTVLLGDGSGGFAESTLSPFSVGAGPQVVVVTDLNGDGHPDIVTANSSDNTLTVVLGDGSGGFAAAPGSPLPVGLGPQGLAVGDLDGDGKLDIVVANSVGSTVTVLLGDGAGGFTQAAGSPLVVGTAPKSIAIGDLNRDGKADLVTANSGNNTVSVLLGLGAGAFAAAASFATPASPLGVVIGDFNGDSKPDVVTVDSGAGVASLLAGDGSGGLAAGNQFTVGLVPYAIAVGDFNGDGKPDLAAANAGSSNVTVLLGNGAGGFTQAGGSPFPAGSFPAALAVGDFNGDGRADVAVANAGDNTVTVLLGLPAVTGATLTTNPVSPAAAGLSVTLTLTVTHPFGGFGAPTGPVAFLDAGTGIGNAAQNTTPYSFAAVGLSPGVHTLTAIYAGDNANDPATSNTVSLTVLQYTQTVTFGALSNKTAAAAPFNVTATASSGLAVVFSASPASVCTVSGATVTLTGAGVCTMTASQPGDANYAAATAVNRTFTVTALTQTITFGALPNQTTGTAPITLTATASSGLPVSYTAAPATVCAVASGAVTLVGAGTCTITATQPGGGGYAAATAVSQHFNITKASQTITFGALSNLAFGSDPFPLPATASSGLTVVYTASPASVCTVSQGVVTLAATGTCTITASQPGDSIWAAATSVNQHFSVTAQAQTIAFNGLTDKVFGAAAFPVSATATSGLAVTFTSMTATVCTVSGSNVKLVSVGSCTIQAAQSGNASWSAATPAIQTFNVARADQTITFAALHDVAFGTAAFKVTATVSSGLAITFTSSTPSVCTVTTATVTLLAVGDCTIQASQPGNTNYTPATPVGQQFTITQATQTIKFTALSKQVIGAAPFTVTATASSGLPVSFDSPTQAVCTVSETTVTLVTAGTCTIQASQAGNTNWAVATPVSQNFTVAQAAQTINFTAIANQTLGTAPFPVSAAASSGLEVSFTATTASICSVANGLVTLLNTGSCGIKATQTGNSNYAAAPAVTRTFTVAGAPLGTVSVAAVLNAASYTSVPLASESWASVFGSSFARAPASANTATRPTTLGGVKVTITDVDGATHAAQIDYVSPGQINFLVPKGLPTGAATVTIGNAIGNQGTSSAYVAPVSPSVFTADSSGAGPPAAIAVSVSPDSATPVVLPAFTCGGTPVACTPAPIDLGTSATKVYLELFATGVRGFSNASAVKVTLGGTPLQVTYVGAQPTFAGLDQINVLLDHSLAGLGPLRLLLTVDGVAANPVTISLQ